ncbi:MAG: hypothetical protein NTV57_16055 [Cyanobacteria bacterium]|nr:hypothetical protein [Cyanobacteriota bacterium]
MTTFTEALIQIVPEIRTDGAAAVRSSLIGLGRQLQEDPESQTHSLQTWWQWLDDEGYDRETFATILTQVCNARIGEQPLAELSSFTKASKNNPAGIAMLLERIKQSHPSFAEEVETLESLALEEENQLGATAGGLGKGGKIALATIGAIGVVGLVSGGIYLAVARKNKSGTISHGIEREAVRESEIAQRTISNESREVYLHVADDPQKIIDSLKSNESQPRERYAITQFNDKDLSDKAEIYTKAHTKQFERDVEKLVKDEVEKSYLNDEDRLNADTQKYFEANGGSEEKRMKEMWGENLGSFARDGKLRDIEKYKGTAEYDKVVSTWGKTRYGREAESDARKAYEKSTESIQQAYKDLLVIEKAYKENGELHALSKAISKAEGFANKDVDKAIEEIDVFGTKLSVDIEERAKEARQNFDKAAEEFAKKEELEAAQLAEDGARKAEVAAVETEEAAERAAKEDIFDL